MDSHCEKKATCSFYAAMADNKSRDVRRTLDQYCHNKANAQRCVRILVQQIYQIDPSTMLGPNGIVSASSSQSVNRAS